MKNFRFVAAPGTWSRCGRDFFHQTNGSFQSPNYPNPYPKEAHCTWNITVQQGMFVRITFNNIKIEGKQLYIIFPIVAFK